jgi:hypothetical protein
MEIDSYLKSMKQSISILDKHVAQLKEDNAVQISLVEGSIVMSKLSFSFISVEKYVANAFYRRNFARNGSSARWYKK